MARSPSRTYASSTPTKKWKSPVRTWNWRRFIIAANISQRRSVQVFRYTPGPRMQRASAEYGTSGRLRRQFSVSKFMKAQESSIENLRSLGYTEDEARFLYVVATHSGYFSARQYLTFIGAKSGERSMAFTRKVLGKGHAAARLLLRNGRVYHLRSRLVYRAIGREHLRNRREHSVEHMRTKLAILDFVLRHLDYRYLETEDEKVAYFCNDLGIARFVLPVKHYAGAIRERTTDRYFVDKFPMFFSPESSSPPVVTFSFVDPGLLSLASFDTHLFAYSSLFSALPHVQFV